jgi:hypothetical protein
MRAGYFIRDGQKIIQPMADESGNAKGLQTILTDRGL